MRRHSDRHALRREAAVGLVDVGTDVGRALEDVGRVVAGLLEGFFELERGALRLVS